MKAITQHQGRVAPLDRANVDTDLIIPKQYLKSIKRTGFGIYLFDELRFTDEGWPGKALQDRTPNPDFALNQDRYAHSSILLSRENFGCGSSREHAPWALEDYGIRVIIAPSFADIFYNNCFKNGILPVVLDKEIVQSMFDGVYAANDYELRVDLQAQKVRTPDGKVYSFEVDAFRKHCLLNGLDEIGLTLESAEKIKAFEARQKQSAPWLYDVISQESVK
jgi:3-isopropylmalate/(R)-2-methylmalate dehydratase small subunit